MHIFLFLSLPATGRHNSDTSQLSDKLVQVTRVYNPTIEDADKISMLPSLVDTSEHFSRPMSYNLLHRPVETLFPVRPLPAAKLGRDPLGSLPHWYVKAGYGNYISPLLGFYYSSGRSERLTYGFWLNHESSWGRVKLYDGHKVRAAYSRTQLGGDVRAVVGPVVLTGKMGYGHAYDEFYGADSLRSTMHNPFWLGGTNAHLLDVVFRVEELFLDTSKFHYDATVSYGGYYDSRSMNQSRYSLSVEGHKFFKNHCFGGRVKFDYLDRQMPTEVGDNIIFSLMPWVRIFGDRWRVQIGVDFTYDYNDGKGLAYFLPNAHLSYDVVEGYFVPYVEVLSEVEMADYRTIRSENPWVSPGLRVRNPAKRLDIVAGMKGKFNDRFSYNLRGSYAIYDSAHFFVNRVADISDSIGIVSRGVRSDFGVVYDNADVLHVRGELNYRLGQHVAAGLQGDYWHWSARHIGVAWHKPTFMATARVSYNLQRKLYAALEFYCEGGRKAKDALGQSVSLPILYDLNLHAKYKFASGWALFLDLRNIIACRYDVFYRYPAQRFNGHLGVVVEF